MLPRPSSTSRGAYQVLNAAAENGRYLAARCPGDEKDLPEKLSISRWLIAEHAVFASEHGGRIALAKNPLTVVQALCAELPKVKADRGIDLSLTVMKDGLGREALLGATLLGLAEESTFLFAVEGNRLLPHGISGKLAAPSHLDAASPRDELLRLVPSDTGVLLLATLNLPDPMDKASMKEHLSGTYHGKLASRTVALVWNPTPLDTQLALVWPERDARALKEAFSGPNALLERRLCGHVVLSSAAALSAAMERSCAGRGTSLLNGPPSVVAGLKLPASLGRLHKLRGGPVPRARRLLLLRAPERPAEPRDRVRPPPPRGAPLPRNARRHPRRRPRAWRVPLVSHPSKVFLGRLASLPFGSFALLRALAVLSLALVASPAAAKPVYLTVPRAFGTDEAPVIDLAFQRHGPVELRVVKPEPLEPFLSSQVNLRRAYLSPQTRENPGRWLARGLNHARLPATFLYRALGEDYRRDLAPSLPKREDESEPRPVVHLAEGPEKLVDLPPGTKLVRETWLNLDLGGAGRDYSVPGFDEYDFGSAWEERKVTLEPFPAGIYLVQLVQGRVEGQVVLVVTDLRVQVKQTDGDVLVRVAGKDLSPVGAEVELRTATSAGPTGKTDDQGEVHLASKEPRLLVLVKAGLDRAVVDTDFYTTLALTPDLFLYTDRPIYRPGDLVKFRGIMRKPDAFLARLFTPRSRDVKVSLDLPESQKVSSKARVDEFGCFSGELKVPADVATGVVRLTADLDGSPHGAEARVDEYVKPSFYLEVTGETETVRPGETLKARVRARRFSGGPPLSARYQFFLYRTLLDSPAWVDDAGLGAQGSLVTYGSPSTSEGKLSVPERLYSSLAAEDASSQDPWAHSKTFDPKGEAEIEIPVPALEKGDERLPWRYSLSVRARDDQGTFANGSRPYFLAPSEVIGTVRPGATVTVAGGETPIAIRATSLSGAPYGATRGTVAFVLRRADGSEKKLSLASFTTEADGVWRGKMPAPQAGTTVARVTLLDKAGHPWSGEGFDPGGRQEWRRVGPGSELAARLTGRRPRTRRRGRAGRPVPGRLGQGPQGPGQGLDHPLRHRDSSRPGSSPWTASPSSIASRSRNGSAAPSTPRSPSPPWRAAGRNARCPSASSPRNASCT